MLAGEVAELSGRKNARRAGKSIAHSVGPSTACAWDAFDADVASFPQLDAVRTGAGFACPGSLWGMGGHGQLGPTAADCLEMSTTMEGEPGGSSGSG